MRIIIEAIVEDEALIDAKDPMGITAAAFDNLQARMSDAGVAVQDVSKA